MGTPVNNNIRKKPKVPEARSRKRLRVAMALRFDEAARSFRRTQHLAKNRRGPSLHNGAGDSAWKAHSADSPLRNVDPSKVVPPEADLKHRRNPIQKGVRCPEGRIGPGKAVHPGFQPLGRQESPDSARQPAWRGGLRIFVRDGMGERTDQTRRLLWPSSTSDSHETWVKSYGCENSARGAGNLRAELTSPLSGSGEGRSGG